MTDIQSATAEIRRGKKEDRRNHGKNIMACPLLWAAIKQKIETTGQKYNVHICYTGRP